MELRHLRYFIAVAEEENVTRAALKLHVSQPALSRQIHDLEEEIGFPLLERTAKSVRLTAAGRLFLGEAKAVIQRVHDAVENARTVASGIKGEIQVGYAPSLTVQFLPATLRNFQRLSPPVRVILHDLSTEEMLAQLREANLQVALMIQPTRKMLRGLEFSEIARYAWRLALAPKHPLASLPKVTLEQVVREPLVVYTRKDYPEYHEALDEIFHRIKTKPRVAEEHDNVTSLIAAVEAECGVALVPESLACFAGPRLKLLPLSPQPTPLVVGAAWSKSGLWPATERFLQCAREAGSRK